MEDRVLLSGFGGFQGRNGNGAQFIGKRACPDDLVYGAWVVSYDVEIDIAICGIRAFSATPKECDFEGQRLQLVKKRGQVNEGKQDLILPDDGVMSIGGIEDQPASSFAADKSEMMKAGQGLAGPPGAETSQAADLGDEIAAVWVLRQQAQGLLEIGGDHDFSHRGRIIHFGEHIFILLNIPWVVNLVSR
jgi:hypothetical protein